jgi:hypothetical protein
MRTTSNALGTILYPDEICFAFNPTYVKVSGCSEQSLTVTVSDYTTTFSTEVMCYNNTCVINLSRTLQLLFDTYYIISQRTKEVTVHVGSFTFTTVVIWGYICPGERFNGSRTVRWFQNFPQTVTVFNGTTFTERTIENSSISVGQSWDFTFDYTFQAGPACVITFIADNSRDGVFLRWLDRHGILQYWLFSKGVKETKNNHGGNELTMNYVDRENNSFRNIKRQQYFFSEITQALCAPNVTEEEYTMLESILTSPVIDLYHPSSIVGWEPVRIAKGTNKRSTDVLQDFEFEIELPNINAQSL